jgi:hypothetical protein
MQIATQHMAPHLPVPITLWLVSFALDERNLKGEEAKDMLETSGK